jgi:hypothetical protein
MAINQALLNQIDQELGNSVTSSLTSLSKACDLYEAYVFSLALAAAKAEGASIAYFDRHGNVSTIFEFRTGPSSIFTRTANYSHAELVFANKPTLELHVGVYIWGTAKVRHECDVSAIWRTEAERCRNANCHPSHKKVAMAAECKLYQKASITIGLGRGFLGLTVDAKGINACFVSDNQSASIKKLLDKHKKESFMSVVPSNVNEVKDLTDFFRGVFIDFKLHN